MQASIADSDQRSWPAVVHTRTHTDGAELGVASTRTVCCTRAGGGGMVPLAPGLHSVPVCPRRRESGKLPGKARGAVCVLLRCPCSSHLVSCRADWCCYRTRSWPCIDPLSVCVAAHALTAFSVVLACRDACARPSLYLLCSLVMPGSVRASKRSGA